MNVSEGFKYWAFVSYSHKDRTTGEWIHKALEAYKIPKPLRDRNTRVGPIPKRLFPIFRDRAELAAAPELGNQLEAALRQSRYLIVVCSPESAASPWVNKEVAYFKSLGREDRVFSLIIDGEPYASEQAGREKEECFPKALRFRVGSDGRLKSQRSEPLAADARADKDGKNNALLKLIAGMLDVGFDSLRQRDLEQRNARLRRIVGASVMLVMIFAGLALYAFNQKQRAEERSRVAQSRQLALQSRNLLQTSSDLPLLLSLEALSAKDTVEAKRSLFEALTVQRHPISILRAPVKTKWNSLVLAHDGKILIGGGHNGQLAFWDLTGRSQGPDLRQTESGKISAISISRDGEMLAAAGEDGTISLWDLETRQQLETPVLPKQAAAVTAVAFGPPNILAFGTWDEELWKMKVTLWDLAAQRQIGTLQESSDSTVTSIVFSPDGKLLASAAIGGDTIIWDLASRKKLHSDFLKDTGTLAFSPDGKLLAAGSWQLTLRRVSDFEAVTFDMPDAPTHVSAVEFSPDGRFLASAALSGNVIVWDPETRRPVDGPFQLNIGFLDALVFSPEGETMYVSGEDGRIAKIEIKTHPLRKDLKTDAFIFGFSFDQATGEFVSLDEKGDLQVWDVSSLQVAERSRLGAEMTGTFALSHDGKKFVSGNHQGRLAIWDLQRKKIDTQPIQIAGKRIDRLSVAPDDRTLAVVALGREVILWDIVQHRLYPKSLQADPEFARDAVFSKDGTRLVTSGDGGEIIQWDWRTGQRIGWSVKSAAGIDALALSPDGLILAAGDYNNKITLWNMKTGDRIGVPLAGHTNLVRTLSFSPDGRYLASGGDDGAVLLWEMNSYQLIAQFHHGATVFSGDGSARTPLSVNRVAFSPDGKLLAADGPENCIVLWDVDLSSWKRQACRFVNRNLTEEEWERYVSDQDEYSETCPGGVPREVK